MFLLCHDASQARCPRPGWTDNLPAADFLIIHDGRRLSHSGAADTRFGFARALILIVPFAVKTVQMERQRSAYYGSYASGAFSIRSPSSPWLWGFAGGSVQYSRKEKCNKRSKQTDRQPCPASSICHWQWNSRRCRWAASDQLFCCRFYRYDPYLASKEGSYSGANCKVSSGNAGAAEKLNEYATCYCPIEKRPCHRMQGRLFHCFLNGLKRLY